MSIFNILLTIHILFGTICLITGIVAMVAQKKKGKHTEWGEIYHASYVVITLTAIILSIINWDKIAYLFYVAIFSYSFAIYDYLHFYCGISICNISFSIILCKTRLTGCTYT